MTPALARALFPKTTPRALSRGVEEVHSAMSLLPLFWGEYRHIQKILLPLHRS